MSVVTLPPQPDPRIPVRFVTGDFGVGKTAFIIQQMTAGEKQSAGLFMNAHSCRRAKLALEGDGRLCPAQGEWSVCSLMGEDLRHALYQLHLRKLALLEPTLHHQAILVEVDAHFDVEPLIAELQSDTRLDLTYRFGGIAAIVDVGTLDRLPGEGVERTLAQADEIILGGAEPANPDALTVALEVIGAVNPFASVHALQPGERGVTDRPAIALEADFIALTPEFAGGTEMPAGANCQVRNYYADPRSNDPAAPAPLKAARMVFPGEMDIMDMIGAVRSLHGRLGRDLQRMSAQITVRNEARPITLEIVGSVAVPPAYGADAPDLGSEVTIIARDLDVRRTFEAFGACVWGTSRDRERAISAL